MSKAWWALILLVENMDATRLQGTSFFQVAETMRQGGRSSRSIVALAGVGGNVAIGTGSKADYIWSHRVVVKKCCNDPKYIYWGHQRPVTNLCDNGF